MINQIDNDVIRDLYSKFSFTYHKFNAEKDDHDFMSNLFQYFSQFKFLTYHFSELTKEGDITKAKCIFCVEGKCFIIDQIYSELINDFLNNLKSQKISLINVRIKANLPNDRFVNELKESIQSFCNKYPSTINSNIFVKSTIDSIMGYLIYRYKFPSYYFEDSSFFNFDEITDKIITNGKYEFQEDEFITLRKLYANSYTSYKLVVHIPTFYIFVMKEYYQSKKNHEENFCKKYSHECFVRFYGFVLKNQQITGFIYEFMSNDSLNLYIKNNQVDELYLIYTIIKISNGIDYLHKNGLIHRDLKPSNILLDHNLIPHISVFETIRSIDSPDLFTNDLGSQLYSSPEQENVLSSIEDKEKPIKPILNSPNIIYHIYDQCVQYKAIDRIIIEEIKNILKTFFASFNTIYEDCLKNDNNLYYLLLKLLYEQLIKFNNSDALNYLGYLYEKGYGVSQDYNKARENYEQ